LLLGDRQDAVKFLDWGFQISFAGNATYKKAENLREAAREIPLDRLLIEPIALPGPVPYRGKRNEPAFVIEVARTLATLRNLSVEEFGKLWSGTSSGFSDWTTNSYVFQLLECRQKIEYPSGSRVGTLDVCPKCHADLHACRNCQFYDPGKTQSMR